MKTLKSFSALADVIGDIGDNLSDGPKYCTSLYAHSSAESRSGRGVASTYSASITLPRPPGTGGKYGCVMGRTVYRVIITRD